MRVFVTGATGFIGSHLVRVLVRQGYEIHALIRPAADTWRIADVMPSLRVVRGDLGDLSELKPSLEQIRPEACAHLAWYAVPGRYLMAPENLDLLEASIRLARALTAVGCKTLMAAGTCFEYDTDAGHFSEATPTKPRSLYAATKLALNLALSHWASLTGLRLVWPRIFYQFGPFEDERRLVPAVILSLLRNQQFRVTGGAQARDYLPVVDVAEALWRLLSSDAHGPVNIGSGRPVMVRELAKKIGDGLGRGDLLDFGTGSDDAPGPAVICADIGLLRARTGWMPPANLDEALAQTIDWWRRRTGVAR